MELTTKDDWQAAEKRIAAWWEGAVIDRPVIQVTAPRAGHTWDSLAQVVSPAGVPQAEITDWFTNPDHILRRINRQVDSLFWGGEAFPIVFPVSSRMVAIMAAYLGCPYRLLGPAGTAWADPVLTDWEQRPTYQFDPDSPWWRLTRQLLEAGARIAKNRFYVGIPDLNGPSQILALLRGSQELALDLMDHPGVVRAALEELNDTWYRYWQACHGVIHQYIGGYHNWIQLRTDIPYTDLQCDFSIMISPKMFNEHFLPALEQQTRWVERTIYHLDGPGAIRHLDALLALPRLTGIQWIQGEGAAPTSQWLPLLRRIQAGGKLLQVYCKDWEVETLVRELEPEGLLMITSTDSEEQARELLQKAPGWIKRRKWVLTD